MLRRVNVALLALALGLAVACGRQVTPEPNLAGNLAGKIVFTFQVQGTLDFTNVGYLMVINTSGQGGFPYAKNLYTSNFQAFSYVLAVGAVGQSFGNVVAMPTLYQAYTRPGQQSPSYIAVGLNPATTTFIPDVTGVGDEFQITIARSQLALPLPTATQSPGTEIAMRPNAAATPTPSPPPPTPQSSATLPAQSTWNINFFTTASNGVPVDALSALGINDTGFSTFAVNVNLLQKIPYFQPSELSPPPTTNAQIAFAEVDNYP
jgi:hypothetical protein